MLTPDIEYSDKYAKAAIKATETEDMAEFALQISTYETLKQDAIDDMEARKCQAVINTIIRQVENIVIRNSIKNLDK